MIPYRLKRFLLSPLELHLLGALLALGACIPALFPEVCPEEAEEIIKLYAGWLLMGAFIASCAAMGIAGATHIIRLNNIKALGQLLRWAAVWGGAVLIFMLIAVAANVQPPPEAGDEHPIQTTDTLSPPHDPLTGPEALTIPISTEGTDADTVAEAPNLHKLEEEHEDLLRLYLERSPRWQGLQGDDAFFSKPGHPVMVPPTASGTPGLVHVGFRRLTEGAPLPEGYTVLKPGDAFPEAGENQRPLTDYALDLGRRHYLLLAWRGTAHAETMHRALNAAIAAADSRMHALAEHPTKESLERMLAGRESYAGSTPEIRLSEPPGQAGAYQAEIYANPGEAGTLLIYVRELESGRTLRLFTCTAHYSANEEELFRHNVPGDIPDWQRRVHEQASNLPQNAPVFTVGIGSDHRYFGAALEVWFKPTDAHRPPTQLLRRCYRVQFLDTAASAPAAKSEPIPEAAAS
ncbi:MAG: hypothetical protein MJ051_02095 [Akkermansia sp.]|nr:hypothetical protein [Akkermansia sp.]